MLLNCLATKAPLFLLLMGCMFLGVESYSNCYNARLKPANSRQRLIDDCDLVKDNLHLAFDKITWKPDCISHIHIALTETEFSQLNYYDYEIGGKTAINLTNPLVGTQRCVKTHVSASVIFSLPIAQIRNQHFEYELNPLAKKCLKSTEFTRTNDQMTVDIAEAIPVKLWETCIFSVSYGSQIHHIKEPVPRRSIFVDFTTKVCGEEKHEVFYKFWGREITTITKMFSFKDVRSLGRGLQVIRDCDILEDQFKIHISQMISKPECNTKTLIKVGDLPLKHYTNGVGSPYESRDNQLKDTNQQCFEQKVAVTVILDRGWHPTQHFKLDPLKCFNDDAELKLKEGDNDSFFVDLTRGMAYNEKLFEKCMPEIRILDENNTDVPFEKMDGFSFLAKISSLDRIKNYTLTVEYKFKGNQMKRIKLFVPESPKEEVKTFTPIVAAAGAAGTFIAVMIVIVFCRKKSKGSKQEECHTDENHTYGTYARGWYGEGEYGDGDVVEVVDNNNLYGGTGGAETHDKNEYYGT